MRLKKTLFAAVTGVLLATMVQAPAHALGGPTKGTCLGHSHPYGPWGISTSTYARTYATPNQSCPVYTVRARYGAGGGGPVYYTSWYYGGSNDLSVQVNRTTTLGGSHGAYGSTYNDVFYT